MNAPVRIDSDWYKPGRLWSLLDMLEIYAKPFVDAMSKLEQLGALLRRRDNIQVDKAFLDVCLDAALELHGACQHLDLPVSADGALRLRDSLQSLTPPVGAIVSLKDNKKSLLSGQISQLRTRLFDELKARKLLSLKPQDADLYENPLSFFDDKVHKKFRVSLEDLEEAGKCLALGRNTACAFHVMRAMEPAMQKVAKRLGVAIADKHGRGRTWGQIAKDMTTELNAKGQSFKNSERWHQAASLLQSANIAWRNPTAHPKKTYTDEQAREVWDSVRAFLRHLSRFV